MNDFVSGELEAAVLRCAEEVDPDLMIIEGQSSLRNPTGPCGSEIVISLKCDHVILQHDPGRTYYDNNDEWKLPMPSVSSEIALIEQLGAKVLSVVMIPSKATERFVEDLDLPVFDGNEDGFQKLAELVEQTLLSGNG